MMAHEPYDEEALRLIYGEPPKEKLAGDLDLFHAGINLDADYEDGLLDEAYLARLALILHESPWREDAMWRKTCADYRRVERIGRDRFWWWPEAW